MTFVELYGNQLDIELGSADRAVLFTLARRKKAVNDAMHNFERITHCTPVYGTIPIVSGTAEYDVYANFSNYISLDHRQEPAVKQVDGSGNVTWLQGPDLTRRVPPQLDRETPGWRADQAGTPLYWYLRDDAGKTYLGLDPAPSVPAGWTYSLLVPYLASSTDMTADSDVPFTVNGSPYLRLAPYHQALVHYAAYLLETARKNYPGADRQSKLYAGYVAQYETKQANDGPTQITFRRNYLRDAGRPSRPVDPHRFP